MSYLHFENISVDKISDKTYAEKDINVSVLRLDKIHPVISGNKWFKLKFYIEEALLQNKSTIATFGGAWSNHIVATAAACQQNNLKAVGIIRGEEPKVLSPTLSAAKSFGMRFHFLSRQDYKEKNIPQELNAINPGSYFINEGGYGNKGAEGAATIADFYDPASYTHICCATGTGTMMAGLIKATGSTQQVIGVSVLKNNFEQGNLVRDLLTIDEQSKEYIFFHDYHFGGYAKYTPGLITFMNNFYATANIPSDFVYTGKLFYAVNDLIISNFFPPGSRVLVIHSGGLQGNQSLKSGMLIF